MNIKPGMEAEYRKCLENNRDPYGKACVDYAEGWAEAAEVAMAHDNAPQVIDDEKQWCEFLDRNKERLEQSASERSPGITGFMYGAAMSIISHAWVHGEMVRRWHNLRTQIGTEGEKANDAGGVLNPAILTLRDSD